MDASIFISFASEDRKVASTLCKALEARGFKCWISLRDIAPGENFQVAIVRAIRRAKILLLVFTANSNNSEEMTKELALASQERLIVVPLRVEDVTPNEAFAYEFATRQWVDFFAGWEAAMDQLSERLSQALPAPVNPSPGTVTSSPLPLVAPTEPKQPDAPEENPRVQEVAAALAATPEATAVAKAPPAASVADPVKDPVAAKPKSKGGIGLWIAAAALVMVAAIAWFTLSGGRSAHKPAVATAKSGGASAVDIVVSTPTPAPVDAKSLPTEPLETMDAAPAGDLNATLTAETPAPVAKPAARAKPKPVKKKHVEDVPY